MRITVVVTALVLIVSGCASWRQPTEQRTTKGPTARQMYLYRVGSENQREPTFDEWRQWDDDQERRIRGYLTQHPEVANGADVSNFRFDQQVTVGMTKDQVVILLGQPEAMTASAGEMEKLARRFWPRIRDNATEAWVYPLGWRLYFSGAKLVDITQYRPSDSFFNQE